VIVQLSSREPPHLSDLDRLDRLHAEADGPLDQMLRGPLCEPDDDGAHVWLDVAAARAIGITEIGDDFGPQFDGMIAYATTRGWLNDAATHVRAHLA
jgi:hypothetical protein